MAKEGEKKASEKNTMLHMDDCFGRCWWRFAHSFVVATKPAFALPAQSPSGQWQLLNTRAGGRITASVYTGSAYGLCILKSVMGKFFIPLWLKDFVWDCWSVAVWAGNVCLLLCGKYRRAKSMAISVYASS